MVEYSDIKNVKQGDKLNSLRNVYGTLYIVATPIGNLSDITLRGIKVLEDVDCIFCEDTRITNYLLSHYNIKKPLYIYNDHSGERERHKIINMLQNGKNIALVSDAGSPLIADPGYKLVRTVKKLNINIKSIPGACSVIAAISSSGLPTNRFTFCGFLNKKQDTRLAELKALYQIDTTMIFFIAPNEFLDAIQDMLKIFGDREAALAREITKLYEENILTTLSELLQNYTQPPKGELILIVAGKKAQEVDWHSIESLLKQLIQEISLKDAVAEIANSFHLPKKEVYQAALKLKIK